MLGLDRADCSAVGNDKECEILLKAAAKDGLRTEYQVWFSIITEDY